MADIPHKIVNGEIIPLTSAEIAEIEAARAAWEAGQAERDREAHNAPILADLDRIDTATVRPLRSVLAAQAAGTDPDAADVARLAELEAQAASLRAQLQQ